MQTLSNFLNRISNWKTLSVTLVLYLFCAGVLLKNAETKINELAQRTVGIIDITIGFNPQRTLTMVQDYGDAARAYYARTEMTLDVLYPIVYTSLFCIILTLLFRNKSYKPFKYANLLPFMVMIFDFSENISIVTLLKTFPNTSKTVLFLCEIFKMGKWLSLGVMIVFVLYGLLRLAFKKGLSN
jgi:hypothetical protein